MIAYLTGAQLPTTLTQAGIEFDITLPYSGCYLCGEVFQSRYDLLYNTPTLSKDGIEVFINVDAVRAKADSLRLLWRALHSEGHLSSEHERLARSGDLMTAEAALKLAPLGIIPLEGTNNLEVFAAMKEAPRIPEVNIRVDVKGG